MFISLDWIGLAAWVGFTVSLGSIMSKPILHGAHGPFTPHMAPVNRWLRRLYHVIFNELWMSTMLAMNSVGVFLVWKTRDILDDQAVYDVSICLFMAQTFLIACWSSLLFQYQSDRLALIANIFTCGMACMSFLFFCVQIAGWALLMVPYMFWLMGTMVYTMSVFYERGKMERAAREIPIMVGPNDPATV